jgi:ribonucleoside-triphosphate reductase
MDNLSPESLFNEYLHNNDWRKKENSNTIFSFGSLNKYIISKVTALYFEDLYNKINPKIIEGHRSGDFHIHDLGSYSSYCFGASLRDLLLLGIQGISNISVSAPAKRLRSICSQIANVVTIFQNEVAGAVAFSSWNVYLAPFIYFDKLKKDKITDNGEKIDLIYNESDMDEIKQSVENMIYALNSNSRMGSEPAFSNLTLDFEILEPMKNLSVIVGGEYLDNYTYKSFQKESDILLKVFSKIMNKGDKVGKPFPYPIPTFNIGKKMKWNNYDEVFELAAKTGVPYFGNFMQGSLKEDDVYSMCPLTGDTTVRVKINGKISVKPIEKIHKNRHSKYKVQTSEGWSDAKPNIMPATDIIIISVGDRVIRMGINHLQPVLDKGTISAENIKIGDYLPFSSMLYTKDTLKKIENQIDKDRLSKIIDNNLYHKVVKIERETYSEPLYCFEVDNTDHLFVLESGLITHNCRLRLDKRELINKTGGLFGAAEKTGSLGVFTINLPAIGYKNKGKSEEELLLDVKSKMLLGKEQLLIKKKIIQKEFDNGLYPALKVYLGSLKTLFLTIGLIGGHELCLNYLGEGIETKNGKDFIIRVINYMRNELSEWQSQTDELFNLEYTPAESASYRLAKMDKVRYPDIITSGCEDPYYTNSVHLPVGIEWSYKKIYEHQNGLLSLATGGSVYHNYLKESITTDQVKRFLKGAFSKFDLPYISFSPAYSVCEVHGMLKGIKHKCPECGEETVIFQRITGYVRPLKNFNKGKSSEFKDRYQNIIEEEIN